MTIGQRIDLYGWMESLKMNIGMEHAEIISHSSDYEEHVEQAGKDVDQTHGRVRPFSVQKKINNEVEDPFSFSN